MVHLFLSLNIQNNLYKETLPSSERFSSLLGYNSFCTSCSHEQPKGGKNTFKSKSASLQLWEPSELHLLLQPLLEGELGLIV